MGQYSPVPARAVDSLEELSVFSLFPPHGVWDGFFTLTTTRLFASISYSTLAFARFFPPAWEGKPGAFRERSARHPPVLGSGRAERSGDLDCHG